MKNLRIYGQALGLNLCWYGYPITIIVRDGFGLNIGGDGIAISLCWALGIFLLMPVNVFNRIYFPNKALSFFWLGFMGICFVYLNYYAAHFYTYHITDFRETFTYIFPLLFLWALMYYPNEHVDKILPVTILYTLIPSILLVYVTFSNPNFNLGERVAIKYSGASNNTITNPHPFANNAIRTIFAALLYSTMTRSFILKMLNYAVVLFSVGILFLARTNTSLYTMLVAAFLALFFGAFKFKFKFSKINFKSILSGGIVLWLVYYLLKVNSKYSTLLDIYWSQISSRFYNVVYTATGINLGGSTRIVTEDASSQGRVIGFNYAKEMIERSNWGEILMGEGYRAQYLDIPSLDAFTNYGILGFLLYNLFFIMIGFLALKEFIQPTNNWTTLLAYFSVMLLFLMISSGCSVDVGNWMVFIPYIRFMGIDYSKQSSLPINNLTT